MRIHMKRSGPHSELDIDVDVPKEVWATKSPLKIAEHVTREMANRWAISKGYEYNDPRTLNYYAGMLNHILPLIREVMIKEYQDFMTKVRVIKGEA